MVFPCTVPVPADLINPPKPYSARGEESPRIVGVWLHYQSQRRRLATVCAYGREFNKVWMSDLRGGQAAYFLNSEHLAVELMQKLDAYFLSNTHENRNIQE
jgi:hypothetical protein